SLLSWGPSPPGSVPGCATGGRDPVQRNELDRLWSRCPSRTAVVLALSAVACGSGDDPPPVAHPSLVTWAGDGRQGHDGGAHSRRESAFSQPSGLCFGADGTAL